MGFLHEMKMSRNLDLLHLDDSRSEISYSKHFLMVYECSRHLSCTLHFIFNDNCHKIMRNNQIHFVQIIISLKK